MYVAKLFLLLFIAELRIIAPEMPLNNKTKKSSPSCDKLSNKEIQDNGNKHNKEDKNGTVQVIEGISCDEALLPKNPRKKKYKKTNKTIEDTSEDENEEDEKKQSGQVTERIICKEKSISKSTHKKKYQKSKKTIEDESEDEDNKTANSPSAKIKERVICDEDSLPKNPRNKKHQQSKTTIEETSEDEDNEDNSDEEDDVPSIKSNDQLPPIAENLLYYQTDRTKVARERGATKAHHRYLGNKQEWMRRTAIMPTAHSLTPIIQRRRNKGDMSNDNASICSELRKQRTYKRKVKQFFKRTRKNKTPRADLYDTSDEETDVHTADTRDSKRQKIQNCCEDEHDHVSKEESMSTAPNQFDSPSNRSKAQRERRKREREENFVNPNIAAAQKLRREREKNEKKNVNNQDEDVESNTSDSISSVSGEFSSKCDLPSKPCEKEILEDDNQTDTSSECLSNNTSINSSESVSQNPSLPSSECSSSCSQCSSECSSKCSSECPNLNQTLQRKRRKTKPKKPRQERRKKGKKQRKPRPQQKPNKMSQKELEKETKREKARARRRKYREQKAAANTVPEGLTVNDFPSLLKRLEDDPEGFFANSQKNINKSLLLYYLNSGYAMYDQYKEYDSNHSTHNIDKAKIIQDIRNERLSEKELTQKLKAFFEQHSYTDAQLMSCGCCGIRMRERSESPAIRF